LERPLYEEMFRMEGTHWWFVARRRVLFTLLRLYLKKLRPAVERPRICEIGAGCGITLAELSKEYDVTGMEASDDAIRFCRRRGVEVSKGRLPDVIPFSPGSFDAVLLLDVLEHVERDQEALNNASAVMKDGGIVLATVPAYPWLWTKRDDFHRHRRRYTKSSFQSLVVKAKLRIVLLTYFNTLLFPPAAGIRLAGKLSGADRYGPDLATPDGFINSLLRDIFALERFILPHVTLPFGLSLLCVAQKLSLAGSDSKKQQPNLHATRRRE
jgi:SAM-dependent methyltransferase